jgi:hypothetical protein
MTGFLSVLTAFADRVSPFYSAFFRLRNIFSGIRSPFCRTFSLFAFYRICSFNLCRVSHFFTPFQTMSGIVHFSDLSAVTFCSCVRFFGFIPLTESGHQTALHETG